MRTSKDASGRHREQCGHESHCCEPGGSVKKDEPEIPVSDRDTQENFLQVPWIDVVNELRSVQQSCEQLRTQVEGIASNVDTSHIVASQEALPRRISMIEDGAWYDRNTLMQEQERAAETNQEYQAKVDCVFGSS